MQHTYQDTLINAFSILDQQKRNIFNIIVPKVCPKISHEEYLFKNMSTSFHYTTAAFPASRVYHPVHRS